MTPVFSPTYQQKLADRTATRGRVREFSASGTMHPLPAFGPARRGPTFFVEHTLMTTDTTKPATAGAANGLLKSEQLAGWLIPRITNLPPFAQGQSIQLQIIWSFWRAAEFIAAAGPR
jgi:hypothetical protein